MKHVRCRECFDWVALREDVPDDAPENGIHPRCFSIEVERDTYERVMKARVRHVQLPKREKK